MQKTKKSATTRYMPNPAHQLAQLIKEHKEKVGKVVLVKISNRTTIELPANLSPEELDARVERYKRLHDIKI